MSREQKAGRCPHRFNGSISKEHLACEDDRGIAANGLTLGILCGPPDPWTMTACFHHNQCSLVTAAQLT